MYLNIITAHNHLPKWRQLHVDKRQLLFQAKIFVCRHYLFQDAKSFSGAELKEKTVNFEEQIMSKDKYTSIFSRKIEAIVFIILQIFGNACKHGYEQLTVCCVGCFLLSVPWCDFMNKHMSSFFCKSYLKLLNQIYTKTFRSGRKV